MEKLTVRLPQGMHRALKLEALQRDLSLQAYVVSLLEGRGQVVPVDVSSDARRKSTVPLAAPELEPSAPMAPRDAHVSGTAVAEGAVPDALDAHVPLDDEVPPDPSSDEEPSAIVAALAARGISVPTGRPKGNVTGSHVLGRDEIEPPAVRRTEPIGDPLASLAAADMPLRRPAPSMERQPSVNPIDKFAACSRRVRHHTNHGGRPCPECGFPTARG